MARRKSKPKSGRLPFSIREQLEQVRALLEDDQVEMAELRLNLLDHKYEEHPEVLELWVDIHYEAQNWPDYEWDLYRLVQAAPEHILAAYAVGAAHQMMERPALAAQAAQAFLERWPAHEKAAEARQVLAEVQPQAARQRQQHELPEDRLDLLVEFERAQLLFDNGDFAEAASLAQRLLEQQEDYLPARRLQIQAQQAQGDLPGALANLERLLAKRPDDGAARVQQVQFRLRAGEPAAARQAAEELLALKPEEPATWVQQLAALTWLDDNRAALDLYQRSQQAAPEVVKILENSPFYLHLAAYNHAVQGQEKAARQLWRRARRLDPEMLEAHENLEDLQEPATRRCGPWVFGLFDWLSPALFHDLFVKMEQVSERPGQGSAQVFQRYLGEQPQIIHAAPHMLLRGNRLAIEMVLGLAALSQHPQLFAALESFMPGQHGTDAQRLQAGYLLLASGRLEPGEQRLWLFGDWRTIRLRHYDVTYEPVRIQASPRVRRLADQAVTAMAEEGDFARARDLMEQALALAPDVPELINNLAFIYRELDDLDRAQGLVEDLRQRFPDYLLGIYADAQMALGRGETEEAERLLEQIAERPQLHISELATLCETQVELHMQENRRLEALVWLELWAFHEPDAEEVFELRQEYFEPKEPSGLVQKLARRLSGPARSQD